MIPKIIHYCWFGEAALPPLALECIASWRKYFPGYKIIQWRERQSEQSQEMQVEGPDEIRVFDVNSIAYTRDAYKARKFAFVSDYARFEILFQYGGIYFDTDVEVIRPMDDIVFQGSFMGFEVDPDGENTPGRYAPRYCFAVNPGLGFGMTMGHPFLKQMINLYSTLKFQPIPDDIAWYKTIVAYTTEQLCSAGLQNTKGIQVVQNIRCYPSEYFAPINSITNRMHITDNTRTIHRYAGSWGNGTDVTMSNRLKQCAPEWILLLINRIKRRRYRI